MKQSSDGFLEVHTKKKESEEEAAKVLRGRISGWSMRMNGAEAEFYHAARLPE